MNNRRGAEVMKGVNKSPHLDNKITGNVNVILENFSPRSSNQAKTCDCCPYGYHIDLDFVRYCESVASGEYLKQLKELRKCRRKQRKTMEAYVNYQESRQNSMDDNSNKKPIMSPPPPNLVKTGDSLQDAVLDFEEVLKRTMEEQCKDRSRPNRPTYIGSFDLLTNTGNSSVTSPLGSDKSPVFSPSFISPRYIHSQTANSPLVSSLLSTRSRSDSLSSLDSQSTVSTVSNFGAQVNLLQKDEVPASQQMAHAVENLNSVGLSRPVTPSGGHVNTENLKMIREQMATSLSKMKELEEQVKAIPILQVKISVMKEEKRLLMLQLKSNEVKQGNRNDNHDVLTARLYDLAEKGVVTPRLSRRRMNLNENSPLSDSELASPKVPIGTRSIGIGTNVLKRDVGVGMVQERRRSVGVGDHAVNETTPCANCDSARGKLSSISSSDIDSDSDVDVKKGSHDKWECKVCKDAKIETKSQSMNTESDYVEFVRQKLLEYQIHKLKQLSSEATGSVSIEPEECAGSARQDGQTNTDLVMDDVASISFLAKYKKAHQRDRGVSPNKAKVNNLSVQVTPPKVRTRDFGVTASFVEKKVEPVKVVTISRGCGTGMVSECDRCVAKKTKSVGVGFDRVDHAVCDRCRSVKKVAKGVGEDRVTDNLCNKCKVVCKTVGCGEDSINDNFCNKCDVLQTETVSVGSDDVNVPFCDRCSTTTTVDVAVGDDSVIDICMSNSFEAVKLCDKCNNAIQCMAKDVLDTTTEQPPKPKPKPLKIKTTPPPFKFQPPATAQTFVNLGFRDSLGNDPSPPQKSVGKKKEAPSSSSEDDSSESDSSDSVEEASYDGLKGSITHSCDDDVAIKEHRGASLVLPPLNEVNQTKREMPVEVKAACKVYNDHLMKPGNTKDGKRMRTCGQIILADWFKVTSQKTTNALDVEDYLDVLEDLSKEILHSVVNMTDNNGNTAMHYAVSYGNFDVVSLLLDSKVCDISKQNKAGYTCVMLVSLAQLRNDTDKDVVKRLLQLGDINVKAAQNGQTALMLAVSHGRLDMVKLLAEAGADVNIQDNDGSTALMCASEHGHVEIVKHLLTHPDINANLVDNDGSNALGVAMAANHRDIGLLLYSSLSRGSSPYASLRRKGSRRSTPSRRSSTSTPAPPSPAVSRKSTSSIS